jgi:hypothetical protein
MSRSPPPTPNRSAPNGKKRLNRRQFIIGGTAGLLVFTAIWIKRKWSAPGGHRGWSHPDTLSTFLDDEALGNLGDTYRRDHPDESRPAVLAALIAGEKGPPNELLDAAEQNLITQTNAHNDFVQARLVQLDGWLLSTTEARQCALFSILSND